MKIRTYFITVYDSVKHQVHFAGDVYAVDIKQAYDLAIDILETENIDKKVSDDVRITCIVEKD